MIKIIKEIKEEIKTEDPLAYSQGKAIIYISTIITLMAYVSFNSILLTSMVGAGLLAVVVIVILDI